MYEEIIKSQEIDGFTVDTYACEEGSQVRGNAIASGDDKVDKRVENKIIKRLDNGDLAAWFCAKVTASKEGITLATDYLGACSYKNFAEFLQSGDYHDDMVQTVLDAAKEKIKQDDMKKVFSNSSQVAHIWAQRSQSEGRSSNMYFDGNTIYSYGRHFPLATFVERRGSGVTVILNESDYSVTTSKHKGEVRYACQHYEKRIYTCTEMLKQVVSIESYNHKDGRKALVQMAAEKVRRDIVRQAESAGKRRKADLRASDISVALRSYNNAVELLSLYHLKMPLPVTKLKENLETDLASVIESNQKQVAAALRLHNRQQAKMKAEKIALAIGYADKWKAGQELEYNELHILRDYHSVLLRIKNDTIETTARAEFPVDHGKKAFPLILKCKQAGQGWQRNGHAIHLGHFQIDSIDASGNVVAGCHTVEFAEIERVAAQLGLI